MSVLDYFRSKKKQPSASLAKERLQIVVAHQRNQRHRKAPDYLPKLQQELIDVISKYVHIDRDQVVVNLENTDDCSILELNVTLSEPAVA